MAKVFQTGATSRQEYDFAAYYSIGKNRLSLLLKLSLVNIFAIVVIIIIHCEKLTLNFVKAERQSGNNTNNSALRVLREGGGEESLTDSFERIRCAS